MVKTTSNYPAEILNAFQAYESHQRLLNTRVGCILVVLLMPAGSLLDHYVCEGNKFVPFLAVRLAGWAIALAIFGFLFTELGRKSCKWLGVVVPLLPVVAIAWMIAETSGFASPYYAGLNLVLLAVGFVLQWTVLESLIGLLLVLLLYVGAGLVHQEIPGPDVLFNNFYFILLMDVIVVVGTFFQSRQRLREFALRFELDASKEQLEADNRKLVELDQAKSRFFANISHELCTPLTLAAGSARCLACEVRAVAGPGRHRVAGYDAGQWDAPAQADQ